MHDSEALENLLDKKEGQDQSFYADSAYRSEAIEKSLSKKNIESQIHEKGYRGRPLTKRQQQRNRKKSKVRSRTISWKNFLVSTQMNLSMFVIPSLIILFISLSIVSYQAVKAALGNQVEALRSE